MNTLLANTLMYRWSYFLLAFFLLIIRSLFRRKKLLRLFFTVIIAWLFIRWRFIEPNQITFEEYNVWIWAETTVALIADLHLWVYKDWEYLQKVVTQINARSDVDIVMIAWDFLYNPTDDQTAETLFAPLKNLKKPVYAVLGNHDVFFLVWLWPYMAWEANTRLLDELTPTERVVVLAHNPDVIAQYPNNNADLTLVWHTHCWQIRPPVLYEALRKDILPVEWDFDCWLTQENTTTLFITPGIGEVLFPVRFNNPPTISILHI